MQKPDSRAIVQIRPTSILVGVVLLLFQSSNACLGIEIKKEVLKAREESISRVGETITIDLGQIRSKRTYSLEIDIQNKTDSFASLSKINADCSCTSAEIMSGKELRPQSTAKIRIVFNTNNVKPGEWIREMVLEKESDSQGSTDSFCRIRLDSTVKSPLELSTSEIAVAERGTPASKEVIMQRNFNDIDMERLQFVIVNEYVESHAILSRNEDSLRIRVVGNFKVDDTRDESLGMLRAVTTDDLGELRWEFPLAVSVPSSLRIVPKRVRLRQQEKVRVANLMLKGKFPSDEIDCVVVLRDGSTEAFRKSVKFRPASNSVCPIRLDVPEKILKDLDLESAKVCIEFDGQAVSADLYLE